ncbi:MAG: PD40 domain-containing protein [Acidobacteria bacterium]|nr:PD40 domain-containing protein [Acidobacteriota bacterium]
MNWKTGSNGRHAATFRAGLLVLTIALVLAACRSWIHDDAPPPAWPEGTSEGISGRPSTPYAAPGQTLPFEGSRTVSFDTTEGTELSIDVAPDGSRIVFDLLGDIYALPINGGDARRLTSGIALDTQPVFSPDGHSILFLSDRSGAENLWLMDADGSHPRQISPYNDDPTFVSPEWSPDGRSILVSRYWPGRNVYELWQFEPVQGSVGNVVEIVDNQAESGTSVLGARFSPDGTFAVAATLREDTASFDSISAWGIDRIDLTTGAATTLVPSQTEEGLGVPKVRPAISPDGTRLVFAERRGGVTVLRSRDLRSGETTTLGATDPDSVLAALTHDAIPRYDFLPDSSAIVINRGGGIERVSLATGDAQKIPFTARVEQKLGALARHGAAFEDGPVKARLIMAPDLSPDNSMIAFSAIGQIYTAGISEGAPRLLRTDGLKGYQPDWSPDGKSLAYVSWSSEQGGAVWVSQSDGNAHVRVADGDFFYSHPSFTPDGTSLVVVRSPAEARRTTYMEYGQLRDAELVVISLDGAPARVIASGRIGGKPHFGAGETDVLFNTDKGVEAVPFAGGDRRLVTQANGPNWYFADGPAAADDLRVSPDGKWALAQIAHQLHLYAPVASGGDPFDLSEPAGLHVQLTDGGADYFGWSDDGQSIFWTAGSRLYTLAMSDVVFSDRRGGQATSGRDVPVEVPRDQPAGLVLVAGGRVLTMSDRADPGAWQDLDLLLDGNRIAALAPRGALSVPAGTPTLDASGKFIVPGLIDAHYHVADIRREVLDTSAWGLRTGLAYGVTTLFDPSSLTIDMLTYQDFVEAGEVTGSRLFTTGPAIFDYNDFRSKEQVRAVLAHYRDDYRLSNIKQYRSGNRRVRQWIVETANELGMTVTTEGALSFKLDLTQILDGYGGVEHAMPPPFLHGDVTRLFAESGTSSVLTLMITHGGLPADKVFISKRHPLGDAKYARFAPQWYREGKFKSDPALPACQYHYPVSAESAARMFREGGLVGVGAHGDIPGFGTHWEMQAYVEGGWTPAETLWAATMGSATVIGRDHQLGSLEPGKLADLLILNSDPVEDIRATLDIFRVVKNGRIYDDDDLTELVRAR